MGMALLHRPRHRHPLRKDDVENRLPRTISRIPGNLPNLILGGDLDGEESESLRQRL
jgi:hypothetical protein